MQTQIKTIDDQSLKLAKEYIDSGVPVAFGTETVYGLGANAYCADAVRKVFEVKGRPSDNPLIVHLASVADMPSVCEISQELMQRLEKVLPAPLTVILPKKDAIPTEVTAGLPSVAVRIPASEGARRFIKACGVPIAAPSANTSTRPSPTTAMHVYEDLNGKIPLILDTGECEFGVESTVVDLTHGGARVLRLGGMTVERLAEIFGEVTVPDVKPTDPPLSPGMKYRHYAPNVPILLFDHNDYEGARLACVKACADHKKVVVLANDQVLKDLSETLPNVDTASLGETDQTAAHRLFGAFRDLEKNYDVIVTFTLREQGYGRAVNNRLKKAASKKN